MIVPNLFYTRADGLIQGNLVPVAPIFRVRVDQLLVNCSDHVQAGQKLAVVSNFLVKAQYDRLYQQDVAQAALSQVGLDQGVAQAETNAAMLREKYTASAQDAQRLRETFASYDQAYHSGAISAVDWRSKRNEWLASEAIARSEYQAWNLAEQEVHRIGLDTTEKISKDEQLADQASRVAGDVGHEALVAPVSGYIVDCIDRPLNVVDPGKPLFSIFQPERAYVLAFFSPNAVSKLALNQDARLDVQGVKQPVHGRISAIYPDLAKLPAQLTRFFWQHEQWSKYRPVRISLESVPPDVRAKFYYGAQVQISVRNE